MFRSRSHLYLYTKLNTWPASNNSPTPRPLWGATHQKRREERRRELIIASQQDGQKQTWLSSSSRRHKGNLLPPSFLPQSNRKAFSLRNDLQSDKSNRFTVTAWKGPARTPLLLTWPDLLALLLFPFPLPSTLSWAPLLPVAGNREEWGWLNRGRQPAYSIPPLAQHEPPSNKREKLCFVGVS